MTKTLRIYGSCWILFALVALLFCYPPAASARDFDAGLIRYDYSPTPGLEVRTSARLSGLLSMPRQAGPRPVAIVMHGRFDPCAERHPTTTGVWTCGGDARERRSFAGFGTLVTELTRRGIAVFSLNVNSATLTEDALGSEDLAAAVRSVAYRAALARELVKRLAEANRGGANPFRLPLEGRLNLGEVILIGHSRGADAMLEVALAPLEDAAVRGLMMVAPVDLRGRRLPAAIPVLTLVPFCDGDVYDLNGLRFFDRARSQVRSAPAIQVVALGANHNYFNRMWPDDGAHDDPGTSTWCGSRRPAGGRLTRAEQEMLLARLAGRFATSVAERRVRGFERYVHRGGAGEGRIAGADVLVSTRTRSADRRLIDLPQWTNRRGSNSVGGKIRLAGFDYSTKCRGSAQCDIDTAWFQAGTGYLLRWSSPGARLIEPISGPARNATAFADLTFRIGEARSADANIGEAGTASLATPPFTLRPSIALSVLLRDVAGRKASVPIDAPALQGQLDSDRGMLASVRLPLRAFAGVDLRRLETVEIVFDRTPGGQVIVDGIAFER